MNHFQTPNENIVQVFQKINRNSLQEFVEPISGIDQNKNLLEIKLTIQQSENQIATLLVKNKNSISYFLNADFWQFLALHPDATFLNWQLIERKLPDPIYETTSIKEATDYLISQKAPICLIKDNSEQIKGMIRSEKIISQYVELTNQFEQKVYDYQEKLKSKDDLLGMATHDIRSPLGVIQICAEFLLSQQNDGNHLTNEQVDFLGRIQHNAQKALDLVSDLLDIGRLNSTGVSLNYKDVVLKDYLASIADGMKIIAAKRDISIINRTELTTRVSLDPKRFQQIVENFIGNAIKFSSNGGNIYLDAQIINSSEQQIAKISVTDEGMGIPEDKLNDIFKKYQQVNDLDATKALGVGLGLAIAQQFAKLHNASIEVKSKEGVGSTFSILLPILEIKRSIDKNKETGKKLVLVVEDDPDILSYMVDALQEGNYDVIAASNGLDGSRIYSRYTPDIVISDIKMPIMDGFELLQFVKNKNKTTPFILASGFYPNIDDDLAKSVFKADAMLPKPFEIDELFNTLNNCTNMIQ